MNIVAYGASNGSKSINKTLATYASSLVDDIVLEVLDLNDFKMPLFSQDLEDEIGQHGTDNAIAQPVSSADRVNLGRQGDRKSGPRL